ncbi:MAG: DUF2325 domain-containing protein [Acidovorax sp.]|uniref:DUF2325 domain-containing protein n=1 Tax=Acidovorax sp. TaxID=1872122 RepID=UPI00391A4AAD
MHSLPQEFLALCRQLGDAQQRCSAAMAAQAAEINALRSEIVRLRGALVVRDTRLAMAHDALEHAQAATPGLPRRKAMARHISMLAERITTLSRECLRWRLAAEVDALDLQRAKQGGAALAEAAHSAHTRPMGEAQAYDLDANLAAADLVICQTGCISHDEYWRVQDHCRRTGKPCILVDQPLATLQPLRVFRMTRTPPAAPMALTAESSVILNENGL